MNTQARALLCAIALIAGTGALANHIDPKQVVTDCRTEGEAAGLAGEGLESFVKECVIAIMERADHHEPGK